MATVLLKIISAAPRRPHSGPTAAPQQPLGRTAKKEKGKGRARKWEGRGGTWREREVGEGEGGRGGHKVYVLLKF